MIFKEICKDENIKTEEMPDNLKDVGFKYGLSLMSKDIGKRIVLDSDNDKWQAVLTAYHELAHLLFGHLKDDCALSNEQKEHEAQTFSCVFTALILFEKYKKYL